MNGTSNSEVDGFTLRLQTHFDVAAPGLESTDLEARVLGRLSRRRRLRAGIVTLAGLAGLSIALHNLAEARLPVFRPDPLFEAAGNSISQFLYLSLGSGLPGVAVTCGVLTVLGLALARFLEEV